MHVGIQQAWDDVPPVCLYHLRALADGMTGILPHERHVTVDDGNVRVRQDFSRLDTDPLAVVDHEVGALPAHGNVNE